VCSGRGGAGGFACLARLRAFPQLSLRERFLVAQAFLPVFRVSPGVVSLKSLCCAGGVAIPAYLSSASGPNELLPQAAELSHDFGDI
jgi:hypothetical protein